MNLHPVSQHASSLHFDTINLSARTGNSQTLSVAIHISLISALLFLATNPKTNPLAGSIPTVGVRGKIAPYFPPPAPQSTGSPSTGNKGGGGENHLRPPTFGNLAPGSSVPLVPPRKIIDDNPQLPEPPAVFDPNTPPAVPVVTDLGLPWMKDRNDSAGSGRNHGYGIGDRGGMGDHEDVGAGQGNNNGPYANVVTQVMCVYCPEPPYTEEARKNKLQGKMLLRVLVGEDGKAKQVRLLQSLGMGLDESAERAVYSWRFSPARDANRHPVAAWITIETRFQLF